MGKKLVLLTGLIAIGSMFMTPALAYDRCPPGYAADDRNPQECVRYSKYRPYPVACEAVFFPRNPLCAGRPAYRDFWWTPPFYNWFAYY